MRRWSTLATSSYGGRRAIDFGSRRSATATVRCRAVGCAVVFASPDGGRAVGAADVQATRSVVNVRNTSRVFHFINRPSVPIAVEPGPADYRGPKLTGAASRAY